MRTFSGWSRRFWAWYQRHYLATLVITSAVFLLQGFHLYWLFSDVILERLTGHSAFVFPPAGMVLYVLADYLEIPALISASLLYVFELRRGRRWRRLLMLLLLNTQWVHMLWITDDVVVRSFASTSLLSWGSAAGLGGHLDRLPRSARHGGHPAPGLRRAPRPLAPSAPRSGWRARKGRRPAPRGWYHSFRGCPRAAVRGPSGRARHGSPRVTDPLRSDASGGCAMATVDERQTPYGAPRITPATEHYLQAIYALTAERKMLIGARLAQHLRVSAPSVTQTLQRLERDGYVTLTGHGRPQRDPPHRFGPADRRGVDA